MFSGAGLKPDPTKVDAITRLKDPSNVAEVRSFLGMVTYCGRYIPRLAILTDPLRQLLKANAQWIWTDECKESVARIKVEHQKIM